jgi:hypothetical protein
LKNKEKRLDLIGKVIERRFHGKYPVRKSFQTEFADPGNLFFQVDGIAYSTVPSVNKGIHALLHDI